MPSTQVFERASVVENIALVLAVLIVAGLAMRAFIAQEVEPIATSIGTVCAFLLYVVYRQVRHGAPVASAAVAVISVALLVYALLSWFSHGFRGSVIFAAPMLPLVASLMLGRRGTRNVIIITAAILLFILTQQLSGNLQADEDFPEDIRYAMRAIIMLLSLVGVAWITGFYALQAGTVEAPLATDDGLDPLTGLATRAMLEHALQRDFALARRAQSSISLALIELDKSLDLDAEFGPQGADNCLLGVAEGIGYSLRRSVDMMARVGTHQLAILMTDTDARGARAVGEKARQMIEMLDIPVAGNRSTRVSISVGIGSAAARSLMDSTQLFSAAAEAVAEVRLAGGNGIAVCDLADTESME